MVLMLIIVLTYMAVILCLGTSINYSSNQSCYTTACDLCIDVISVNDLTSFPHKKLLNHSQKDFL